MYQLVLKAGPRKGASWPVTDHPLTIGRSEQCEIRVADPLVSRQHCQVWQEGDALRVRDLGSSNATLVNGQPVEDTTALAGDEVAVGNAIFIVAHSPAVPGPVLRGEPDETPRTVALSEAYYVRDVPVQADDRLPRSLSEFRELFSLSRRLSQVSGLSELVDVLSAALREKFSPDELWLARFIRPEGSFVFQPMEGAAPADRAPVDAMQKALDEAAGVLVPRTVREGSTRRFETTLAAPLLLGEDRIGAIAVRGATIRRVYDHTDLEYLVAVAHAFAPYLRAVERYEQLRRDYGHLRKAAAVSSGFVGDNPAFREALDLLALAANTRLSVLLVGETGTGKELGARMIHDQSPRAGGPFVIVNCAAIPRELFESEMFGHEKGAFTGAVDRRVGRFEEAHGGTLFLDEVGDLSPDNQARLLRVLETGTFYRVGGEKEVRVDVRAVSATNKALGQLAGTGGFRSDLYHRLSGFEIRLPSLRERASDIPLLARHFLDALRTGSGEGPTRLSQEALQRLQQWEWPGNVRELRACIERASALARGDTIQANDILIQAVAVSASSPPEAEPDIVTLAEAEKKHIARILKQHGGNIRASAKALQISRATLYRKMQDYNLSGI